MLSVSENGGALGIRVNDSPQSRIQAIVKSLVRTRVKNVKIELDYSMPMPAVLIEDDDVEGLDITQVVRNGGKTRVNSKYADEVSSVSGLPTASMLRENMKNGVDVDFINRVKLQSPGRSDAIKFKWYKNAYNGFGNAGYYVDEMLESGESSLSKDVAVYWTKNKALNPKKNDQAHKNYLALRKLIDVRTDVKQDRFRMLGLHDHYNYNIMENHVDYQKLFDEIFDDLLDFISKNADVKEIHVWIQGNTEKVINNGTIGDSNSVLFGKLKRRMSEYLATSTDNTAPMFNFPYPDKRTLEVKVGTNMIDSVMNLIYTLIMLAQARNYINSSIRPGTENQKWHDFDTIPFQINDFKKLKPIQAIVLWNYVLDVDGDEPLFAVTQKNVTVDKIKVAKHLEALLESNPNEIINKAIDSGLIDVKYRKDILRLRKIGKFVDGDDIVEWPTAKFFWLNNTYAPFKSRADMLNAHASTFARYMKANPDHVILFNGGDDFVEKHKDRVTGAVVIPKYELNRNIQSRIDSGNPTNQPVDVEQSFEQSMRYKELLPSMLSFDEIEEPGLYMAASGSGKSTYITDINDKIDKHVINVNIHNLVADAIIDLFSNDITKEMNPGVNKNTCLLMYMPSAVANIIQKERKDWSGGIVKGIVIENKHDAEYRIQGVNRGVRANEDPDIQMFHGENFEYNAHLDHLTVVDKKVHVSGEKLADLLIFSNNARVPRYSSITEAVQPGIIIVSDHNMADRFVTHHEIGSFRTDMKSNEVVNASFSDVLKRQDEPINDSELLTGSVISTYHFTALSASNTLLCADIGEDFPKMPMCVLPNTSISGIILEKYKSHPDVRERANLINGQISGLCKLLHESWKNDFIHVSNNVKLKSMSIGEIISETDYDTYYVFVQEQFFLLPVVRTNTIKHGKTEANILLDIGLTTINVHHSENSYIATWINPQPGYAGLLAMRYRRVGQVGRTTEGIMILNEMGLLDASGHALASFSMEVHTYLAFIEEILTLNPNNPFTFPTNEPVRGGAFHTKDEYHAAVKFIMTKYNVSAVAREATAMIMKKIIILENVASFM